MRRLSGFVKDLLGGELPELSDLLFLLGMVLDRLYEVLQGLYFLFFATLDVCLMDCRFLGADSLCLSLIGAHESLVLPLDVLNLVLNAVVVVQVLLVCVNFGPELQLLSL